MVGTPGIDHHTKKKTNILEKKDSKEKRSGGRSTARNRYNYGTTSGTPKNKDKEPSRDSVLTASGGVTREHTCILGEKGICTLKSGSLTTSGGGSNNHMECCRKGHAMDHASPNAENLKSKKAAPNTLDSPTPIGVSSRGGSETPLEKEKQTKK